MTGLIFLKLLTKLINLVGDTKLPLPIRLFFFGANLIALMHIDRGLRPIATGNTLRRIAFKCAGSKALSERQNFFGNLQVKCGTKRGAEIAAHLFRNLTERDDNPNCTVLLKLDFKNAFNSPNRETSFQIVPNCTITLIARLVKLANFLTEALLQCQKTELSR